MSIDWTKLPVLKCKVCHERPVIYDDRSLECKGCNVLIEVRHPGGHIKYWNQVHGSYLKPEHMTRDYVD